MSLLKINKNPSRRELNWFGALFLLFFGLIGALIYWQSHRTIIAEVIWATAAVITVAYYLYRPMQRVMYLAWMYAAFPIGWTVSHLILAITYYGVMTPIGLVMRMCGRDPMMRRFEPARATYWIDSLKDRKPGDYFRQF